MSAAPQADDTPQPGVALPPFDNRTADTILRSKDNVDFYVRRVILSEASTFFADMFSLGVADQDDHRQHRDGVPVIPVTEPSQTLSNLLRFCYPVARPKLVSAQDICDVVDAAQKYLMPFAREELRERFYACAERTPLVAYALASAQGWEQEKQFAARASLGMTIHSGTYISEMANMSAIDYISLIKYHERCRAAVSKEGYEQTQLLICCGQRRQGSVRCEWAISHNCRANLTKHTFKDGKKVVFGKRVIFGPKAVLTIPTWLVSYLSAVRELLQKDPRREALLGSNILVTFSLLGQQSGCGVCTKDLVSNLSWVHTCLADDFDELLSTVRPRCHVVYDVLFERARNSQIKL